MIPTPDISHIKASDYEDVYEPAEDSFLFLDALEKDKIELNSRRPSICLEIGSGSGIVSTFLSNLLNHKAFYLCTDINCNAAKVTMATGQVNKVDLNAVVMNLAGAFLPRLFQKVDVLLFNPPYVVTPSSEVGSNGIEASWAGGIDGRQVMNRLFPIVSKVLSPNGVFYLVIVKENKKDEIFNWFLRDGLAGSTVLERRSGPEFLSVLKFTKSGSDA